MSDYMDEPVYAQVEREARATWQAERSDELARIYRLALAWINQDPHGTDGSEEAVQQVADGHTLLRVLRGESTL